MATVQRKGTTNSFDGLTNTMMVIEEGATSGIARPSSASSKSKTVKKSSSGGLIVLSAGLVDSGRQTPPDCQSSDKEVRISSAGRIEKRLEIARKASDENDKERKGNAEGKPQTVLPINRHSTNQQTVQWNFSTNITRYPVPHEAHAPQAEKKVTLGAVAGSSQANVTEEAESSTSTEDSSDEDDEDDGEPSRPPAADGTPASDTPKAPIELTAQFLNLVMNREYHQAQDLCHQILSLEPNNVTCQEFLTVIAEKIKQDEEDDNDSDDEDEGDDDDDDDSTDESDSDEEGDDDDDSGRESDEEESSDSDVELPPGPVNLLMGGLPVIPQPQDNQE